MEKFLAVVVATFSVATAAQAAVAPLQGRDINGKAVDACDATAVFEYDPNLNITWLRDWSYANTSGYDSDGLMDWNAAMTWASTLTVGAFSGWALPTTDSGDTSCSTSFNPGGGFPTQHLFFDCTGSPFGYLYNTEGYGGYRAGPFQNIRVAPGDYWSSTEYAPNPSIAWMVTAFNSQTTEPKTALLNAVAVRPGDVATPVPEPQTLAMMLAGLSAVVVASQRAHRRKAA